jgi:hypothetical protein
VRQYLDAIGEAVADQLKSNNLTKFASPLFRPFNLAVGRNHDGSYGVVFGTPGGGMASYRWLTIDGVMSIGEFANAVRQQLGWDVSATFSLGDLDRRRVVTVARQHVDQLVAASRMARVGGLELTAHLRSYLEAFLTDYPDPDKNIFVMMPFAKSEHLDNALTGVRMAASKFGLNALRADDRAYSDQLWPNVETYMAACRYGVAIFEDIDQREFNPNISLELGYMLGRQKRCLLLKEQRLPSLPSDIVGHLYRPWDAFKAETTVAAQVDQWLRTDLGLKEV